MVTSVETYNLYYSFKDMLECLEIFAKDELHNNYHSCIVVIMGHGNNGIIWDIEGKPIDIQHILNLFNGENAPGLVGKPKLFISQACRGGEPNLIKLQRLQSYEIAALKIRRNIRLQN